VKSRPRAKKIAAESHIVRPMFRPMEGKLAAIAHIYAGEMRGRFGSDGADDPFGEGPLPRLHERHHRSGITEHDTH
jgi:hypothetical protein